MILNFVYIGKNFDELLIIDTDNKDFVYWTQIKADNPDTMINVKTKKDIDKIINEIRDAGYALKIGGI